MDGILWAFLGYFLPRSRGRALAALILIAAVHITWVAFASHDSFGLTTHVGTNTLRAVPSMLIALAGVRGFQAAVTYHRIVGSVIFWRNVAIVWVLYVVVGAVAVLVVVAGSLVADSWGDIGMSSGTLGAWIGVCWAAGAVPMFILARQRFPWVRPSANERETFPS